MPFSLAGRPARIRQPKATIETAESLQLPAYPLDFPADVLDVAGLEVFGEHIHV